MNQEEIRLLRVEQKRQRKKEAWRRYRERHPEKAKRGRKRAVRKRSLPRNQRKVLVESRLEKRHLPLTRADCSNIPRPCPFISCKWNLYLDVSPRTGRVILNFPDIEPDEMPACGSCALDVAETENTLEKVGEYMNITRERVRQIEVAALTKVYAAADKLDMGNETPTELEKKHGRWFELRSSARKPWSRPGV